MRLRLVTMNWWITILIAALVIYIILDVIRVLKIKTMPSLPEKEGKTLSPGGLTKIYEYCRDPSLIPEGIELSEDYILEEISDSIQYIDSRYDCADFWCQLLFRLYKDYNDKLPDKVKLRIKGTLVGFKFWMDMPEEDSMCYWSENHTLLFSALEYLIGQEWSDDIFPNSHLTGREHRERGKTRITYWVDQRMKFGFFEWYSNNYFVEDVAPLAQLIDYAEDTEIQNYATEMFNLLLFEVVSHSIGNRFCVVSSRLYSDNKASNRFGNRLNPILKALIYGDYNYKPVESFKTNFVVYQLQICVLDMLQKGKYQFPEILQKIALDQSNQIIKSSNGLNSDEYKSLGLIGQHEYQITAQFSNETFANKGFSWNSYKFHKNNGMFSNWFSLPFKFADLGILRFTRALPLMANILDKHFMPTGISLSRGNVYTYRTKNFILSTAVNCHVDYCGTQHHVALACIKDDLNVFTLYPPTGNYNAAPGYWGGNRRMPMSVQDEAINLMIFRMAKGKRLGEFYNQKMTHTLFPREKFDEMTLEEKIVFGRAGETYIALISNQKLMYKEYCYDSARALVSHKKSPTNNRSTDDYRKFMLKKEFDLVAVGKGYHMYVTELSDSTREIYSEFIARIKTNLTSFDGTTLEYHSRGKKYQVDYSGQFIIDGEVQDLEYKRFDSMYATVERMPDVIEIEFEGLNLTFENKTPHKEIKFD